MAEDRIAIVTDANYNIGSVSGDELCILDRSVMKGLKIPRAARAGRVYLPISGVYYVNGNFTARHGRLGRARRSLTAYA